MLNDFEVITIYPEAYKSTITGLLRKGDVNLGGAIAISWKDFVKGYETDFDNVLTVNISRYDSVLTLKYLDKGKMYTKTLTAASEYDFIRFTKIMGQHNVVLKNEGTRVPRIKSRNRWRK